LAVVFIIFINLKMKMKGPLARLRKNAKPVTPKNKPSKKKDRDTIKKATRKTEQVIKKVNNFKRAPCIPLTSEGKVQLSERRFYCWDEDRFVIDCLEKRGWKYCGELVPDGRMDYPEPIIEARRKNAIDTTATLIWADDDDAKHLAGISAHHLFSSIPNTEAALTKIEQAKMFNDYEWFPSCFILPRERERLLEYAKENKDSYFICKPKDSYGGVGMRVYKAGSDEFCQMSQRPSLFVVQEYMARPYLFAGLYKFHLRCYMVISSLSPFRAYLWKNGQIQFSTHRFDLSKIEENWSKYPHITNYKVQNEKKNVTFACQDKPGIGIGTEWSFDRFFKYMEKNEPQFSREKLWTDVEQIARVVSRKMSRHKKVVKYNSESYPSSHFEIFGLDILMTEDCRIALTEANTQPGLDATDPTMPNGVYNSEADRANDITRGIILDSLILVGADTGEYFSEFIPLF